MNANAKFLLIILAFAGSLVGLALYNASQRTFSYSTDITLSGHPVVVEHDRGALGVPVHEPKIIGYFGGGRPRVVAFGCDGRAPDAVLIAVEEDALPSCERVEPIA